MDMLFSLYPPPACKSKHTVGSGFPCLSSLHASLEQWPGHLSGRGSVFYYKSIFV